MRCLITLMLAAWTGWGCLPAYAEQSRSHAHGAAQLDVAVEGRLLTLTLYSPLNSLLGFERAPMNEKDRAAVTRMERRLRKPEALFVPPVAARCRSVSVTLKSAVLDSRAGEMKDGHADLEGEFIFDCEQPQHLRTITVQLFEAFRHLHQVNVQIASGQGQKAARLTARNHILKW